MGNRDKIVPLFVPLLTINRLADIYKAVFKVPRAGFENYSKILNLTAVYQSSKTIYQLIINNIGY